MPDLGLARTGAVPFDFALKGLTLTFEEKNLVLAFLLPGMLNTLPYDEDPEPHIAAGKAAFSAAIETLPAASADGDTRAALLELIGRFPDLDGASGILDLQSASDPLSVQRFLIQTPEDFFALLADMRINLAPLPAP